MKATKQITKMLVLGCVCTCSLALKLQADTFYLRTRPQLPYPSDPYNGALPAITLNASNRVYEVQDTPTDFLALQELVGTNTLSGSRFGLKTRDPLSSAPYLEIDLDDDNYTRIIHFDTTPGSLYNVQESTNLIDWSVIQTVVATDTNYIFSTTADGTKFYRAVLPDDRLQFPGWDDYVEAFANFNVFTTIHGTYHLELYGDGNLLYQTTAAVPTNGLFGVYDGSYDPSQWPNVGGYAIDDWELRVTVTPSVGPHPAQAILNKRQRHPTYPRYGLTVAREGVGAGIAPGIQDDIDMYMVGYLQASGYNVARQVSLANSPFDPSTVQYFNVPKLTDTNSWAQFKWFINNPNFTDLHYFGHGTHLGIGDSLADPTTSISLAEFQNTNRLTHPLKYAAMDGCETASGNHSWQKSKLLPALCGFDKKVTLLEASSMGKWPRFAWGWTAKKQINFASGTYLNLYHFVFIADFYQALSHRNGSGFLDRTFEQAIYFGQNPNGLGTGGPFMTTNPDGYFLDYLGCGAAHWDD